MQIAPLCARMFSAKASDPQQSIDNRLFWAACMLIFALGTVMRFWELSSVPLWRDEAVTLGFARLDLWTILSKNIDNHPPLAWVIQHIWHGLNPDPAAARVPAATAGSLAVLFFVLALRDLIGERAALFGGLLLAFSTSHIHYSQDARMYTFLVFGLILAAWGAIGHAQPGKLRPRSYAMLYVLGGAIAIYSHMMGLVAMAVIGFTSLASGASSSGARQFIRDWFVRNIALFVVVLPWLVLIPSAISTFPGLADVSPSLSQWFYRNVGGFPGLTAIGAPFELLLLAAAALSIPVAWFARQRALAIFFLGMIIVYPLIITLLHLRPGQPILSNRAMMPILAGIPFGAAYAFSMLKSRLAGTVLALVVAAAAFTSAVMGLRHNVKLDDFGGAYEYVDAQGFGDAPILTCDHFCAAAAWENRNSATILDYRDGGIIRYKGPEYWQVARISMVELRLATTEDIDAELGGGWQVKGGLEEALRGHDKVAVFNVWCADWEQALFGDLETLGFRQRGEQHRVQGKAASYTIMQDPEARVVLFERIN